jgi:ABC-2 type transport system permease protein
MKALQIAWKDTLTRLRDWKAVVGLLAAPLIISALIGLAFGNIDFNEGDAPLSGIAVVIVNQDDGVLGQGYVDALSSEGLRDLLDVREMDELVAARAEIEAGEARAVVYIPPGLSDSVLPNAENFEGGSEQAAVQVFTDPAASVSPYIVQSIVEQITTGMNQLLLAGEVSAAEASVYAAQLGPELARLGEILPSELDPDNFDFESATITLEKQQVGVVEEFNAFAFFIPGMAVFFLMFSMFEGSRSILQEETHGTLPRLMSTPTSFSQIILGKMGGSFLTGLFQFIVLMLASWAIFGINWGSSIPGLILLVVLTVFAASSLGSLLTVFARDENQAGVIGGAVALVFGALGGSFFPAQNFTGIINTISKLTLNRWAMDGFITLTVNGGGFNDILLPAGVLAGMLGFQRRFVR